MEEIVDYKEIGRRIKSYRMQKTLGQSELARIIGISQTHLSNLEHGRTGMTLDILVKLAKILECSLDELALGAEPAKKAANIDDLNDYRLSDLLHALKMLKNLQQQ